MADEFFTKEDVSNPDTITRDIHEHEVLFSFNDDAQSLAFYDWWREEGIEAFTKYANAKSSDYI